MIPDYLRSQISELPRSIGVYRFRDEQGHLLYVGKSKELRTRVSSYFRGNPKDRDLRLQRMIRDIRSIDHLRSSSELLALLLEDSLIKHGDPVYNLRQNKYRRYIYLTFTDDRYPRLRIISSPSDRDGPVYGPFPDEYFLPRLESFLGRYYGLRNCHEKNPTSICMQADLGLCLAPCADVSGAAAYSGAVDAVHTFLTGVDNTILDTVKTAMEMAVEGEEFEIAGHHRDELQFAESYIERMAFTRLFIKKTLVVTEDKSLSYEFVKGDLSKIHSGEPLLDGDLYLLEESPIDDDRFQLDRAYILSRWLSRHGANYQFS